MHIRSHTSVLTARLLRFQVLKRKQVVKAKLDKRKQTVPVPSNLPDAPADAAPRSSPQPVQARGGARGTGRSAGH
jgi:hypothetical protein